MGLAARLILAGLSLVAVAVAAYFLLDWQVILAHHPHYVRPLKAVMRRALDASWVMALGLPAVLLGGSIYRFAVATSGRMAILARLFAWFTLWAIGSVAFYFGLFLAYAPALGQGGAELAAPALAAVAGYMIIGLGIALAVLQK